MNMAFIVWYNKIKKVVINMKLGLVLGGGGGRGAYQIGVWEALKDLGIDKHVKVISGTSIGALNAMLFMQGDMDIAKKAWVSLHQDEILPIEKKDIILKSKMRIFNTASRINKILDLKPDLLYEGEFSREGLLKVIDEFLDTEKALNSSIRCYCTVADVESKEKKYFRVEDYNEETIKNILLASSAIPGLYDAVEINNRLYLDGGLKDNVPIDPVYNEGCDFIIVVRLCPEDVVEHDKYPNAQIIDIALKENKEVNNEGLFDFTTETINQKMKAGYDETMNLIGPIFMLMENMVRIDGKQVNKGFMNKLKGLLKK